MEDQRKQRRKRGGFEGRIEQEREREGNTRAGDKQQRRNGKGEALERKIKTEVKGREGVGEREEMSCLLRSLFDAGFVGCLQVC